MTSIRRTQPVGVERTRASRQGRGFIMSYGEGRTCAETGCGTTLSRYNKAEVCAQHTPGLEATQYEGHTTR